MCEKMTGGKFQIDQITKCNCHEEAEGFSFTPFLFYSISLFFFLTNSVHDICLSFSFGWNPWQLSHYIYKHSYCIWHDIHHFPLLLSSLLFSVISCFLVDTSGLSCGPKILSTQFTLRIDVHYRYKYNNNNNNTAKIFKKAKYLLRNSRYY